MSPHVSFFGSVTQISFQKRKKNQSNFNSLCKKYTTLDLAYMSTKSGFSEKLFHVFLSEKLRYQIVSTSGVIMTREGDHTDKRQFQV